jgi:protein-arginine kinase
VEEFNLEKDSIKYKISQGKTKEKEGDYPWGSSVYYTKSRSFAVLANFDDHFTLMYKITSYSLKDSLAEIDRILHLLQKFVRNFSYHSDFGFLTPNPQYSGSGLSIFCRYVEAPKNENAMEIEREEHHQ